MKGGISIDAEYGSPRYICTSVMPEPGGPGGPWPHQYLADQLTLFEPGRADYPPLLLLAPPNVFHLPASLNVVLFRGAPDARVITLSSAWHKHGVIHWDDPDYAQPQHRKYRASEAYSQSKLANVLFTRELARRLEGTGVNA